MGEFNPTMLEPDDDDFEVRPVEETVRESNTRESDSAPILSETPRPEALMEGVVTETTDTFARVELPDGSEGVLPYEKLLEGSISIGDEMLVKVLELDRGDDQALLSEQDARADYAWERVRRAYDHDTSLEGDVVKVINGGVLVRLFGYLTAFMPMSHLTLGDPGNPDRFVGETVTVRIIEYDRDEDNVVVSRRVPLEEKHQREQRAFFRQHEEGEWVTGTVKNVVEFGAFINLGAVDGLLHESDLSWGSVDDVEHHLSEGDEVEVQILSMEPEDAKVSVGLKQKDPDPWETIDETYQEGEVHAGEVIDVRDDGLFLRFEEGVNGRIPRDELAWVQSWNHPAERFSPGESLEVKILSIDPDARRMRLSRKRTVDEPWSVLRDRFPEGTVVSAPVVDVRDDHLTVRLLKRAHGIIRRKNVSWNEDTPDLHDRFSSGEKVTCKVLRLDDESRVVELGMKQTRPDPWVQRVREFSEGDLVEGKVTGLQPYGVFVRLAEDLEGLVHVSEMGEEGRVNPRELLEEGETVGVKILSIDEDEHKMDLSMQGYKEAKQRQQVEEYMEEEGSRESGNVTMGDLIGDDLEDFMGE